MKNEEPKTIGLTKENQDFLRILKEEKFFNELMDAYKFAIAFSIKSKEEPSEVTNSKTMFAVGNFDGNQEILNTVLALRRSITKPYYAYIEKLANHGVKLLKEKYNQNYSLDLAEILKE